MIKTKLIIFMPTIDYGGGVEKNFFTISNYLCEKFDNITIITLDKSARSKLNKKINFICPKNYFFQTLGRRTKFLIALFYLFKSIIGQKNPKVFSFQGHVYCILLCKLLRIKVIVRSNTSPFGWSKNFIKKILYRFIYSLADEIIVNSLEFKKEMKNRFNLNSKSIYNPLDISKINKLSKVKIKFKFFTKNSLNLINVARLNEQKDQITLLKSINFLKKKIPIKLLIIGNGKEKQKILNYINKNKLSNIIKILPFRKNPFPYILKSNLFILSSRYEGLPNILLETVVLKKPILSSNCSTGPKEILDNGLGGLLFKKGNYIDLSKKIIFFKKNKKQSLDKANYAYKRLRRFDYKVNLSKYYKMLIN